LPKKETDIFWTKLSMSRCFSVSRSGRKCELTPSGEKYILILVMGFTITAARLITPAVISWRSYQVKAPPEKPEELFYEYRTGASCVPNAARILFTAKYRKHLLALSARLFAPPDRFMQETSFDSPPHRYCRSGPIQGGEEFFS